ncbi:MAG TPA: hypothetical protein VII51_00900 [Gaiellaceae bacterium]
MMRARPAEQTAFSFNSGAMSLRNTDVTQLLASLHGCGEKAAESIAEEIESLMTARVRVDLRPSAAETAALASAIRRILAASPGPRPHFTRMLGLVCD